MKQTYKLNVLRTAAIEVLTTTRNVTAAARKLDVNKATLHRWLKDPVFKSDLDRARMTPKAEEQSTVTIPVRLIIEEPMPGMVDLLSEAEMKEVRQLRSLLHQAECCGPFDPRHVLVLEGPARAEWIARRDKARRRWLKRRGFETVKND